MPSFWAWIHAARGFESQTCQLGSIIERVYNSRRAFVEIGVEFVRRHLIQFRHYGIPLLDLRKGSRERLQLQPLAPGHQARLQAQSPEAESSARRKDGLRLRLHDLHQVRAGGKTRQVRRRPA